MGEFFRRMFDSDFMPHGFCWKWEPWVVWANVVSDLVIFVSYLIIGFTLLKVASKRHDMASNPVMILFGAFIISCGCTHAMEVYNTWHGLFRLAGLVKIATAAVSLLTVGPLMEILPKVLAAPDLTKALTLDAALSSEQQEKQHVAVQLRESQDRFRLLVEGIKDFGIFLVDPEGLITSWNPGAERITGYTGEEVQGRPLSMLFPPEEVEAGKPSQLLAEAASNGRLEQEAWRIRKDGGRFLVHEVITPFYDAQGGLKGFAKVARDITAQRADQTALRNLAGHLEDEVKARTQDLRESEARLKGFIDRSPAAIACKDLDGRYLLTNLRMEAMLGRPSGEILGRTDRELLPPDLRARALERDRGAITSGKEILVEEAWAQDDGTIHQYLFNVFPVGDAMGGGWGLGLIATDITQRKLADRAQLQSQKLESLGILTGGIAHDFNNLLGAIQGNVELALAEPSQALARPFLETLLGLTARGAGLLRQMLAYAGQGRSDVRNLDLNRLVAELTRLLATSISKKAVVSMNLHGRELAVKADPAQLQQVVMNLVINASEALEDQPGTITLATRPLALTQEAIDLHYGDQGLRPGNHVGLTVADTGVGMAQDLTRKIFDPFFTTKFAGRGLGLAAIQGIIRGHGGGIHVASEPGRGSTFTILLPAAWEPLDPEAAAVLPAPAPRPQGSHGVLVVDDEPAMRAVVVKALERAGLRCLQAANGREALALYEGNRTSIQLILMDLTMPVMDGEEACRALRRVGVDIPILLTSGFNEAEAMVRFDGLSLAGFIQKPFKLNLLVDRVLQALAE